MEGSRAVIGRRYHRSTPPSPHIHTLLLVSPNPNPILSPNSFVRTFSTQSSGEPIKLYFQIFIRFWSNPCTTFFWFFSREYLFEYSLQTGCADVIYDCPIFCRKFRDIWRCKVVWVGVDIISVELPLPTFLQSQDPEDQYHSRHHHHSRHCHHKSHHLEHCHNFVSYILLWQKIRRAICQIFCTSMLSNNSKFTW